MSEGYSEGPCSSNQGQGKHCLQWEFNSRQLKWQSEIPLSSCGSVGQNATSTRVGYQGERAQSCPSFESGPFRRGRWRGTFWAGSDILGRRVSGKESEVGGQEARANDAQVVYRNPEIEGPQTLSRIERGNIIQSKNGSVNSQ